MHITLITYKHKKSVILQPPLFTNALISVKCYGCFTECITNSKSQTNPRFDVLHVVTKTEQENKQIWHKLRVGKLETYTGEGETEADRSAIHNPNKLPKTEVTIQAINQILKVRSSHTERSNPQTKIHIQNLETGLQSRDPEQQVPEAESRVQKIPSRMTSQINRIKLTILRGRQQEIQKQV